ncbi:MAG: LAGLIDADG family homing endonuclease [Patescibacteria group bacterium]
MSIISSTVKSYIAGFLDGDGCIMFQLIRRQDYKYGFQIRASIVFYQKTKNKSHLEWVKSIFNVGYLRDRGDDMTEYTIVGLKPVIEILKLLEPYIRLKRQHVFLAKQINSILSGKFNLDKLLKASELVDQFAQLNYSKKRINTSESLKLYLRRHKLHPRND